MVRLVEERTLDERVRLKFEGFVSICPFTGDKDRTDFELEYTPGQLRTNEGTVENKIDAKRLEAYLASLENKSERIAMEVIPTKILQYCIEDLVNRPRRDRATKSSMYAAPSEAEIRTVSLPLDPRKGKSSGIRINLVFRREVCPIQVS